MDAPSCCFPGTATPTGSPQPCQPLEETRNSLTLASLQGKGRDGASVQTAASAPLPTALLPTGAHEFPGLGTVVATGDGPPLGRVPALAAALWN